RVRDAEAVRGDADDRIPVVVLDPERAAAGDHPARTAPDADPFHDTVRGGVDSRGRSAAVVRGGEGFAEDGAPRRLPTRADVRDDRGRRSCQERKRRREPCDDESHRVTPSPREVLRYGSNMMRNRTTVKAEPGLFLQPFVISQLSGAIIEGVVAGSDVTANEY